MICMGMCGYYYIDMAYAMLLQACKQFARTFVLASIYQQCL
jgi:hypothetical protein